MPISNTRPCRRTLPRKLRLNCLPWASGTATLRSMAIIRRASITAAMSIPIGQRVVQASHEAHSQIACEPSTSASAPRWTSRMTWLGRKSMSGPIGQPVVHLWHWKHALTGVPLRCWTSSRKPSGCHGRRCHVRWSSSYSRSRARDPSRSYSHSFQLRLDFGVFAGHHLAVDLGRRPQHAVDGQQVALDADAEQPLVLFQVGQDQFPVGGRERAVGPAVELLLDQRAMRIADVDRPARGQRKQVAARIGQAPAERACRAGRSAGR